MDSPGGAEEDLDANADDNVSGDGADDGDDGDGKQEYVKRDLVPRPYECTSGVLEEVQDSIIKDSRPRLRMRISRKRRDFGNEGVNFIDKDASEQFFVDLK